MKRAKLLSSIVLALALASSPACSGPNDDGGTESVTPIDKPSQTNDGGTCAPTAGDGPTMALERDGGVDTFLWPGDQGDVLRIDYDVVPPAVTRRVRIEDEVAAAEAQVVEELCPETVALSALGGNGIRAALVTADDGKGGDVRTGRVFQPAGDYDLDVSLPSVDGDGWYVLVEPAEGTQRLALMPVSADDVTAGSITVRGVTDRAATVALIRDDGLRDDTDNHVTWAPAGWVTGWKGSVAEWYGALRFAGGSAVALEARRTAALTTTTISLGPTDQLAFTDHADDDVVVAVGIGLELAVDLTYDCNDPPRLQVASFSEVTIAPDAGDPQVLAPNDVLDFADADCSGSADVPLRIVSLNQHDPVLILMHGGEQ